MSSFGEQPIADRLEMVENENGPVQRWTGPLFFMKKVLGQKLCDEMFSC
jgi:hypothetical protein